MTLEAPRLVTESAWGSFAAESIDTAPLLAELTAGEHSPSNVGAASQFGAIKSW
jgi:hypothetical protein